MLKRIWGLMALLVATTLACVTPGFGQSGADQSDAGLRPFTANASQRSRQDRKDMNGKKASGPGKEMARGGGDIGTGAAKGAGDLGKGAAYGAGNLVTGHPVKATVSVGKGAGGAVKNVGVGAGRGFGKIGKGIGGEFKKIGGGKKTSKAGEGTQ